MTNCATATGTRERRWRARVRHKRRTNVVPDGLFLELLKVLGQDLGELVEEGEQLGGVGVAFGQSENCRIWSNYALMPSLKLQTRTVEIVVSDIPGRRGGSARAASGEVRGRGSARTCN